MGDFAIPRKIHYKTWDFPFMPEKASVPEEWLSDLQRELNEKAGVEHNSKQKYLLQTMHDKHDYFVYRELLAFYIEHGVEIIHITCGIKFKVDKWLKDYIMLNTRLRDEARVKGDTVAVNGFKLMVNSIFGKLMQNNVNQSTLKVASGIKDAI